MSRIDIIGANGNDGLIYHHNHTHGHASSTDGLSPTYVTWRGMKDRCYNPNNHKYPRYGGRGITICDEWEDFIQFLADMGEKPEGMSIDRIENDGNYEPNNCKWSTTLEQANNTSNNVPLTYKGVTKNLAEWEKSIDIPRTTFYRRYYEQHLIGDDLFAPTCHTNKQKLFQQIEQAIIELNEINFTKISNLTGIERKKASRLYKEFNNA